MSTGTEDGTLLVPLVNPETADRLLDTSIDIARSRSMRIVVLHVVEVPPQIPLSQGERPIDDDGEEVRLLDAAVDQLTAVGLPVESRIRYARDIATGIVSAVEDHDADGLLAGWRGRPRRRDIIMGSFLDHILGEAKCDVFVKRIRRPPGALHSILVPVAGGPHCELAVELAGAIATQHNVSVQLLHVENPTSSSQTTSAEVLQKQAAVLAELNINAETMTLQSDHIAGAITDETAKHDLTILGATRDPFLKRKFVGLVAQGVGRAAASSVMLARRAPDSQNR